MAYLFNLPLSQELKNDATGEIEFRSLRIDDIDKNFLLLLSQLTSAPNVSKEQFQEVFKKMQNRFCFVTMFKKKFFLRMHMLLSVSGMRLSIHILILD